MESFLKNYQFQKKKKNFNEKIALSLFELGAIHKVRRLHARLSKSNIWPLRPAWYVCEQKNGVTKTMDVRFRLEAPPRVPYQLQKLKFTYWKKIARISFETTSKEYFF